MAARYQSDGSFSGEGRVSAVWPARTHRGLARVRTGHARGAIGSSGSYGEKIDYLTAAINTILTIPNRPTRHRES